MAEPAQDPQDQPSGPPSSSGLAAEVQGVASIYDFVWRAGTQVTQAVGGAVAKNRDRKSLVQAQKSYLGPWSELAYYDGKRQKTPVLRADKFRDYMVDLDGKFTPEKVCTAQADWAQLLHALGIKPSNNVVAWKSPRVTSAGSIGSMNPAPEIEIDGEVLCHVLNLFGDEKIDGPRGKPIRGTDVQASTNTSFACIFWDTSNESPVVRFTLGDDESITNPRKPFGRVGEVMETGTLITKHYFNAVYQPDGCSDAEFSWPSASRPLEERVQDLDLNIRKISALAKNDPYDQYESKESRRKRLFDRGIQGNTPRSFEQYLEEEVFHYLTGGQGPQRLARLYARYAKEWAGGKQSVLLTRSWLEEANRIWRRATCGDGSDDRFLNDIYQAIDKSPEIQELEKHQAPSLYRDFTVERLKTSYIRPRFHFEGDPGFAINLQRKIWVKKETSERWDGNLHWAQKMIRQVLESYKDAATVPGDSWKHDLYVARNEVYWLLLAPKLIEADASYVRFLHFRPESKLWNGTWQLKSE